MRDDSGKLPLVPLSKFTRVVRVCAGEATDAAAQNTKTIQTSFETLSFRIPPPSRQRSGDNRPEFMVSALGNSGQQERATNSSANAFWRYVCQEHVRAK